MTFPAGVTTATGTLGAADVDVTLTVWPSVPVVHAVSGEPLWELPQTVTGRSSVSMVLPHTDQAGFVDGAGNTYTNWHYVAVATLTDRWGQRVRRRFTFQLLTGQDTVDLDLVGHPAAAPGIVSGVVSVMGHTGVVTTPQVEAALHAAGWSRVVVSDTPPAGDPNTVWVGPEPLE